MIAYFYDLLNMPKVVNDKWAPILLHIVLWWIMREGQHLDPHGLLQNSDVLHYAAGQPLY